MQVRILKGHADLHGLLYKYPKNWGVKYYIYSVV